MQALLSYRPPSPALRGWVRQHQFVRLRFAAGSAVPVKAYWPRPAAALAFYPRDLERIGIGLAAPEVLKPRAVLIGQPTVVTQRLLGLDSSVYQIEFEPGALHRLLGLNLDELTDRYVDAEAALPSGIRALADLIEEEDQPSAQMAAAERYLLGLVQACRRRELAADRVAARLIEHPDSLLEPLARMNGLSLRQLQRQAPQSLGVGPRLLARIARFDRAVRTATSPTAGSLLQLAVDAGYHDHQHLARDFRQFTLSTPSAFLARERGAPEQHFGLREG
ncbi:MAG: AraC family transcriptional regulator [Burkholderiales bacterium]|uniref:AraC family transcriptional regulator n=1 Tax=Inhella sp. TaxID=1921806 RepID=UPI001ACA6F5F|nr:AraC family transcriptional regulator [Burkholderiales bacterium]